MPSVIRPLETIEHDPDAELIYSVDWDDWLNEDASIDTAEWFIVDTSSSPESPLDMTSDNETIAGDGRSASARIKNGTTARKYRVTCRIVTDETPTQTDDRSFFLKVKER